MAYFNDVEEIQCPYCGEVNPETDWHPNQDESTTVECGGCGKEYTITAYYSLSITTTCGSANSKRVDECEFKKKLIRGEESWIQGKIYAECIHCEETAFVEPYKIAKE